MEDRQKEHIRQNLPDLIKNTVCNAILLSTLQSWEILSDIDCEELRSHDGKPSQQALKLYNLLIQRTGAFEGLIEALYHTKQTGAYNILQKGFKDGQSPHFRSSLRKSLKFRSRGTPSSIVYDKKQVIGRGSFDTKVYKGTFGSREVAVKKINCESLNKDEALGEIGFLVQCDWHENIVRYFTVEERDEFILIALELFQMNLSEWVKTKGISASPIEILRQTTKGIAHLHLNQIIHRDLKPENILLASVLGDENVRVKISDFGISKKLPDGRCSVTVTHGVGTYDWMAPEVLQFVDDNSVTYKTVSDIFSLGCIFYYVLTDGQHPFGYGIHRLLNLANGVHQIATKDLKHGRLGNLGIIVQMLSLDPNERPSANALLNHPMFWSNEKVLRFLSQASITINNAEKSKKEPCLDTLNKQPIYLSEIIKGTTAAVPNWVSQLCPTLQNYFKTRNSPSNEQVEEDPSALFHFVNHLQQNFSRIPKDVQLKFEKWPESFLTYWEDKFPLLIQSTYFSFQSLKSEPALVSFYPKSNEYFTLPRTKTRRDIGRSSLQRSFAFRKTVPKLPNTFAPVQVPPQHMVRKSIQVPVRSIGDSQDVRHTIKVKEMAKNMETMQNAEKTKNSISKPDLAALQRELDISDIKTLWQNMKEVNLLTHPISKFIEKEPLLRKTDMAAIKLRWTKMPEILLKLRTEERIQTGNQRREEYNTWIKKSKTQEALYESPQTTNWKEVEYKKLRENIKTGYLFINESEENDFHKKKGILRSHIANAKLLLETAISFGHFSIVRLLIEQLQLAAYLEEPTYAKYLLQKCTNDSIRQTIRLPEKIRILHLIVKGSTLLTLNTKISPYKFKKCHFKLMLYLIKMGLIDVTVVNAEGRSIIHHLCSNIWMTPTEFHKLLDGLLKLRAVNIKQLFCIQDKKGLSPLHLAVQTMSVEVATLKFLSKQKVNFNIRDKNDYNIVHYAIRGGRDASFIKSLFGLGANGFQEADDIINYILDSTRYQNLSTLDYLLNTGYPVNVKDVVTKSTPLHYAVDGKLLNITKGVILVHPTQRQPILYNGVGKNHAHFQDNTQLKIVRKLLEHKANANEKDGEGRTPLHRALFNAELTNIMKIVELLTENGADMNAIDKEGSTLLHKAPFYLSPTLFHQLVLHLVKIGQTSCFGKRDSQEFTPIYWAVLKLEVLESTLHIFKKYGVDFNKDGAVMLAAIRGRRSVTFLQKLVEFGVNLFATDNYLNNYLHVAANEGNIAACCFLIDNGCDINAQDDLGYTPLQRAFVHPITDDHEEILKLLVSKGADADLPIPNEQCDTPRGNANKNSVSPGLSIGRFLRLGTASF
ncbi:unnamed protein product [Orchesella dallaii]|uniref:Uncharacterized protein n=1 Tax=Orchesella dallaii TaxID=48710 RepID=A0ABP1SA07_9HEXA